MRIFEEKQERRVARRSHRGPQRNLRVTLWNLSVALRNKKLVAGVAIFLLAIFGTAVNAQNASIISAEGQVVPQQQVALSFQIGGTVETVFVVDGDLVEAGDPLLQLDPSAAELGLQQAQVRLATAQSGLLAAENELSLAETAVQTAEAQLGVAEANLALVEVGAQPEQIAAAESRVAAAEAAVSQAIGQRDVALDVADASDILAAEAAVAAAQAEVQQLEQAYQEILDSCFDTPQGEVCPLFGPVEEQTRQQLNAARLNQDAAQAALEALQNGATPAQQQAANAQIGVAQANVAIAQAQLELLWAGATPEQIQIAAVAVDQAQVGLEQAAVQYELAVSGVVVSETAVSLAEAGVAQAELALERTFLRAAFDGAIVSVGLSEGELAAPAFPIVTMANYDSWQIETIDLTELDVALVAEGAPVAVRVDALPDLDLGGVVTAVSLLPNLSRGDVVYRVTIDLAETADLPLRWGMTAFVDIDAAE